MRRSTLRRILIGLIVVGVPFAIAGTTDGGTSRELLFAEVSLGGLFAFVRLRAQPRRQAEETRGLAGEPRA
jgi:hypothetical protein